MNREWTAIELNETFDLYKRKAWFMDGVHTMPRWAVFPLDQIWPQAERGLTWACQKISHPQCKGWMWRTREGSAFLSPIMITDEAEQKSREAAFRENLKPFLMDFAGLWEGYKKKWDQIWEKMDKLDIEKASDIELEDYYRELTQYGFEVWKDHFYIMEGIGSPTLLFEDLAKEMCGINSSDPLWAKLCSGFPSKAFESDDRLHELAMQAVKTGLKDTFAKYDGQALLDQLKTTSEGQTWIAGLKGFLATQFGMRQMQLLNYATPTWRERPDLVADRIKLYVVGEDFKHQEMRAQQVKEREEAEKTLLAKVPAEQRDWFILMMRAAQNWGWWSEEHEFWLNEALSSRMRSCLLEFGKRWAKYGTFDKADDIFHIRLQDFERVIHAPWDFTLRPEVAKHRGELAEFAKINTQPVVCYDTIPGAVGWLLPMREFHVALSMGYMPEAKEGVNASMWGTCGCPGTVEGPARIVFSEDQFPDIQKGDILVCPTTYVTWTPIFSKIGGLIVDRGGSLSHSAICAREYNVPCVLNTFAGTQVIKNGQKIRLQADIGAVFILD